MNPNEDLPPVKILTARQAKSLAPDKQPNFDREYFRKVMRFTFHTIDTRTRVGYSYAEMGLTQFPKLEARRIKMLKRLGYTVREQEFTLFVGWEDGK
jgi:hypothetical protein